MEEKRRVSDDGTNGGDERERGGGHVRKVGDATSHCGEGVLFKVL